MSDPNTTSVADQRLSHGRRRESRPKRPNVLFHILMQPDNAGELLPQFTFEHAIFRANKGTPIQSVIIGSHKLDGGAVEVELRGRFKNPSDPSIVPTSDEIAGFVRSILGGFAETSTNGSSLNFKAEAKDGAWPKKFVSPLVTPVEAAASKPKAPATKAPGLNFEVVIDRDRSRAAMMSSNRFLENLSYVAGGAGLSFEVRGKHRMSNAEQISLTARFASSAAGVPDIETVGSVIERAFGRSVDVRRDGNEFEAKAPVYG
jgi:hypothetical protein